MIDEVFARIDHLMRQQKKKNKDLNEYLGLTKSGAFVFRVGNPIPKYQPKPQPVKTEDPHSNLCAEV